jgi:hypothetical protein
MSSMADLKEMQMHQRTLTALAVALAIGAAPGTLSAQNSSPAKTTLPPGPVAGTKSTEEYARLVARDAFFWAWPMVNVYNRRLAFKDLPQAGLMGGIVPVGPPNRLSMLTDYIEPQERLVACPNQDVVYGFSLLALDQSPIVIQVPDFGDRFWVYQVVDLRTDSFAEFGKMYGTKPGFYLLAGPNWAGTVPKGITRVFRSTTNTGVMIPRVFQDDTVTDKKAVQAAIAGIDLYPLAEFDGKMKRRDWAALPKFPSQEQGEAETKWVVPDKIFDVLPAVLKDAPPLPGEGARYEQVLGVVAAAQKDPELKKAMIDEATKADKDLVEPLLQFRNFGLQLPHYWSTVSNGAAFGTDYFTRTAVGKSNIFVNKQNETKYFYQDLDEGGQRLNGTKRYTVTFPKGQTPPVRGFWSLTLYNQNHFFATNDIKRYSIGTKNKTLKYSPDGSLTIYVQADPPVEDQRGNWLPAPKDADFSLYVRSYWPQIAITDGSWTPPAVQPAN